jgi:hypothetical protein
VIQLVNPMAMDVRSDWKLSTEKDPDGRSVDPSSEVIQEKYNPAELSENDSDLPLLSTAPRRMGKAQL